MASFHLGREPAPLRILLVLTHKTLLSIVALPSWLMAPASLVTVNVGGAVPPRHTLKQRHREALFVQYPSSLRSVSSSLICSLPHLEQPSVPR
jgi:hypothetical protein